jgi:hypothetical protein
VGRIVDQDRSSRQIYETSMTSLDRKENQQHAAYVGPACRAGFSPEGELVRDTHEPNAVRQDQHTMQSKSRQVAKSFPAERTYSRASLPLLTATCVQAMRFLCFLLSPQPFSKCSSRRVNGTILIFILLLIIIPVVLAYSQLSTVVNVIPQ